MFYQLLLKYIAGVPDLRAYQNARRKCKKKKTEGVELDDFIGLLRWAKVHALPSKPDDMTPFKTYAVPMDWTQYIGVEAVALTSHVQVGWIKCLVDNPGVFVLHVDGKHKLHHGKGVLVTVGTHVLKMSEKTGRKQGITHSFRPLVYMFCKQHESADSIVFLLNALNWCILKHAQTYCSILHSAISNILTNISTY